ncbi:hypothetical protein G5B40_17680 [Pikeienuella piscinae]|uniref:Uncharacterized protein n=1 Tax=Pikeienuella piscinae TaxID=2748098 RepID=A0A7L5C1T9_9RHOB|nr:hypothetical protein [Pikeienuella piscinae]QIE57108.1 hypothetical protein G5B40_17680 [Pikeienuella piscinae]
MKSLVIAALICSLTTLAVAGEVAVIDAKAERSGAAWRFDVTVNHADEGWDHYADAWRVIGPDGTVYGERTLLHPHVDEQPFTRSLSGVAIPDGVETVLIEAHDSRHGWGAKVLELRLPR